LQNKQNVQLFSLHVLLVSSPSVAAFIKKNIHHNSFILPHYGALYGDYENKEIKHWTFGKDGFNELFGYEKPKNMQATLFEILEYPQIEENKNQILKKEHKKKYTNMSLNFFWSIKMYKIFYDKNIFILINEDKKIINLVKQRLIKMNECVDLIILKIPDVVYHTKNGIKPLSKEAYEYFINIVQNYFMFI
jgi:hydroxymethylpyrimidine pyrophosphatase-like HAD family hydrolase